MPRYNELPCGGALDAGTHGVRAPERGSAEFGLVNACLTAVFLKYLNCAKKPLNTKVVVQTILYNICKGRHMFR
jgi:hypothetical protein